MEKRIRTFKSGFVGPVAVAEALGVTRATAAEVMRGWEETRHVSGRLRAPAAVAERRVQEVLSRGGVR